MYYKQYGNTDMKVSAIGLGTMRYDEEDIAAGRLEKCAEIPLYAFEKGINYWDTAPFYCDDKSEIVTGIALSQVKRSDVYVTSKTNFNTIGQNPTRDDFRRRLEMSLQRLQTDYIDFYHMWCLSLIHIFLPPVNSGGTAGAVFCPVGFRDEHTAADRTAFQVLIPENLRFQRPVQRQDRPAEPLTADRERSRLRAGAGVPIVKNDAIAVLITAALPADQGVCLLPLCRGHVAEGTVRLALQRW